MSDFMEQSKKTWMSSGDMTDTQIAAGCLQRIALAVESLNRSWCEVIRQNVSVRETNISLKAKVETQDRKIRRMTSQLKKAGINP